MREKEPEITCPTFRKQEHVIKGITKKINGAGEIREKVKFAIELQKEVDVLLSCPDYGESGMDCKNCRFVANLRKKTADIIVKTEKLA